MLQSPCQTNADPRETDLEDERSVVDAIFPGWIPWRRFAVAQDTPAYFEQVKEISKWDFGTLVGGHVARIGTRADVTMQLAFIEDLKAAARLP